MTTVPTWRSLLRAARGSLRRPVGGPGRPTAHPRPATTVREALRTVALAACASVVRRLLDLESASADAPSAMPAGWQAPWDGTPSTTRQHPDDVRSEVMMMAAMCNGCLVLHRDGEIAYCSEELDGKACLGYDAPHLAGVMACRVTPRGTRCRHCDEVMRRRLLLAPDFIPDGLWAVAN